MRVATEPTIGQESSGWQHHKPAGVDLNKQIEVDRLFEHPIGQKVKDERKRARNRLGLEVVQETGLLSPAGITTNLDHSGPNRDSKAEPAK